MENSITIDGVVLTGSVEFVEDAYNVITKAIRAGKPNNIILDRGKSGDYTVRHVIHVTATTSVLATLAYSPVDSISEVYTLN